MVAAVGRYAGWSRRVPSIGQLDCISVEIAGHVYRLLEGGDQSGRHGCWLWCSSVVLARRVAELDLAGKTVLDLGCGLGLVGMVAARIGAIVTLCDLTTAERATSNLAANGLAATVRSCGWDELTGHWQHGFASDVFFTDTVPWEVLTRCCERIVAVDAMNRLELESTTVYLPERDYHCNLWESPGASVSKKP